VREINTTSLQYSASRGATTTMSAADVAVGMMDGAYFTSRNELLTFFNTLLTSTLQN